MSTHQGHLHHNGVLTWFCNETAIMISHVYIKICNSKLKHLLMGKMSHVMQHKLTFTHNFHCRKKKTNLHRWLFLKQE